MSRKENKLFDVFKFLRRMKYRVSSFFQYRVLADTKHLLLLGNKEHPLCQKIYQDFSQNWRIAHVGYFDQGHQIKEQLSIDLNEALKNNSTQEVLEIEQQILSFSKYYESIIVLSTPEKYERDVLVSGDIDVMLPIMRVSGPILERCSKLATKILYTNGLILFTAAENCYDTPVLGAQIPNIQHAIKDVQIQHLGMILAERDDLENDTLVMNVLLPSELEQNVVFNGSTAHIDAAVKYIKMWSDGIKRPASGTFVRFKQSEHQIPIIYPEIF